MIRVDPTSLGDLFTYKDGRLYWRDRDRSTFGRQRFWLNWNGRFAGKEAGTLCNSTGYRFVRINQTKYWSHRIIWAMHNGQWPDTVDHVNGDVSDNRVENLRSVTRAQNQRNLKMPKHNTSGIVGVAWIAARNKWMAQIRANKTTLSLGRFDTKEEAVAARKAAEREFGYHPNHGRAA